MFVVLHTDCKSGSHQEPTLTLKEVDQTHVVATGRSTNPFAPSFGVEPKEWLRTFNNIVGHVLLLLIKTRNENCEAPKDLKGPEAHSR
jgi:hypothetical protein